MEDFLDFHVVLNKISCHWPWPARPLLNWLLINLRPHLPYSFPHSVQSFWPSWWTLKRTVSSSINSRMFFLKFSYSSPSYSSIQILSSQWSLPVYILWNTNKNNPISGIPILLTLLYFSPLHLLPFEILVTYLLPDSSISFHIYFVSS